MVIYVFLLVTALYVNRSGLTWEHRILAILASGLICTALHISNKERKS